MTTVKAIQQNKISQVNITDDTISAHGGVFFLLRYFENTHCHALEEKHLGLLKTSGKDLTLYQFAKQLLAYFIDASDISMTSFDRRKYENMQNYIPFCFETRASCRHTC